MKNLTCPQCNTVFNVDESNYAHIQQQVRNDALKEDVDKLLELALQQRDAEEALRLQKAEHKQPSSSADKPGYSVVRKLQKLVFSKETKLRGLRESLIKLKAEFVAAEEVLFVSWKNEEDTSQHKHHHHTQCRHALLRICKLVM